VAAVAAAPRPRHAVVAVPRPAAAAPDPEGERRQCPCAGKRRRPRGPEAAALPRPASKRHPRCASRDGDTRGARFERHHERCEVRAATIAHDILRSGAVRAARMTTYICAYVVDDVLQRLPPPICVCFFDYCVLYLPHVLFTLKTVRFYA
jgi:hypothetical protein